MNNFDNKQQCHIKELKIPLVRSQVRVPDSAGQEKIYWILVLQDECAQVLTEEKIL